MLEEKNHIIKLQESDIETGDLLFFQGDDPQSKIIRYYCDSKWSHVGMAFKVSKSFMVDFKSFFDKNVKCQENNRKIPTIDCFLKKVTEDEDFYAALKRELKIAKTARSKDMRLLDDRVIYLWESTENEVDPCQITNKKTVGVKLTNLSIRASGYSNIVGLRRLTSGKKIKNQTSYKIANDFGSGEKVKLYDFDIYLGMLYGMYCNLNKDYEKTYWDLIMCWLYDFKYRYGCCDLSCCNGSEKCMNLLFPACCYDDYHYLGEYQRFFCAELVCLTLIQIFELKESLKNTLQSDYIGYEECLDKLKSSAMSSVYNDRTVVSIEYLLSPKTFCIYCIGDLIIYDKLYCS